MSCRYDSLHPPWVAEDQSDSTAAGYQLSWQLVEIVSGSFRVQILGTWACCLTCPGQAWQPDLPCSFFKLPRSSRLLLPALQFVGDHLGMADVRLYIRDVLREYAALQVFDDNLWTRVQPSWNAVQYSGDLLLQQFAYPYRYDFEVVRAAYPWLHSGNATSLSWILDEMLDGTAAAPGAAPLEQSSAASNSSNPPTSSS